MKFDFVQSRSDGLAFITTAFGLVKQKGDTSAKMQLRHDAPPRLRDAVYTSGASWLNKYAMTHESRPDDKPVS